MPCAQPCGVPSVKPWATSGYVFQRLVATQLPSTGSDVDGTKNATRTSRDDSSAANKENE